MRPLQLFTRFLRFGLLAWGGPVAQIAMLKRELVDDEQWIDPTAVQPPAGCLPGAAGARSA